MTLRGVDDATTIGRASGGIAPTGGAAALLVAQVVAEVRQSLRVPEYVVGVVAVPVILYALFGLPVADQTLPDGTSVGAMLVASFAGYAVVSIAIFTCGVDVAGERERGWLRRLRVTPMPMWAYFAAKIATAMLLSVVVYVLLWTVAVGVGRVPFDPAAAGRLLVVLLLGMTAFSTMGFTLAFAARPKAAAAIGNLVFLPLSFCSGFFTPLSSLPEILRDAAPWLPTYHFGVLAWRAIVAPDVVQEWTGVAADPLGVQVACLIATFVAFGILSVVAYARDRRRERD